MKPLQYTKIGKPPEVVEIDEPERGPGQVLQRVTAAGACHSDIAIMSQSAPEYSFPLPLTLGHAGAGVVAAIGSGVKNVAIGDSIAVFGPWGCGPATTVCKARRTTVRISPRRTSLCPAWSLPVRWPSTCSSTANVTGCRWVTWTR